MTRDIQHDLLPRFLTTPRSSDMMGEARHRRSQLYDLDDRHAHAAVREQHDPNDQS